ncbi:MAG: integral rane sensor signal transduction histidine kinase [Bryobacterales bacterium]|nr:integral rane sensor signal transduction histidine kinase [Bryobacterales bacterium]
MQEYRNSAFVRFLIVLSAGFALLILLLGTSAWLSINAIRTTEATAGQLVEEQRATLRLIGDIEQEQDSLSAIFYSLAVDQSPNNLETARAKLANLEVTIRRTLDAGMSSAHPDHWSDVRNALDAFLAEGRIVIETARLPRVAFFRNHEVLITALGKLATVNFDEAAAAEATQAKAASERVRSSVILLAAALVIAVVGAVMTVRSVTGMFRQLQWQELELAGLSSRTMADQEETARRFSRELHDEFGQTLTAIEASLVSMHNSGQYNAERMEDALIMVKAAIGNARELSQLLRPSILDDFGLDTSLAWLAESFSQRTGIQVEYVSSGVERPGGDIETQLFRIAQEALTNVARHADASLVRMELERKGDRLTVTVTDNGSGLSQSQSDGGSRARSGLGLVGMRARARAARGELTVSSSAGKGVTIRAELPAPVQAKETANAAQNSHHTGG